MTMEITDDGKKRLLQSGFLAGLVFIDSKYAYLKELPENEFERIERVLGYLFKEYGLSKELV